MGRYQVIVEDFDWPLTMGPNIFRVCDSLEEAREVASHRSMWDRVRIWDSETEEYVRRSCDD